MPAYTLRPNATVSNSWDVALPALAAHDALDDAVTQPTAPDTLTDAVSTSTATAVCEVAVADQTLGATETVTETRLWVYAAGGTKRSITVDLRHGTTSLGTTTVGAGAAAGWVSVTSTVALTQAQVNDLRCRLTCNSTAGGGGQTAVAAYAAYVALTTSVPSGVTARTFDGVDDFVEAGDPGLTGAFKVAVLARRASADVGTWGALLSIVSGDHVTSAVELTFSSTNTIGLAVGGAAAFGPSVSSYTGQWVIYGVDKTAGSATPRFHIIPLSGTPVHSNGDASLGDPPSVTSGKVQFGRWKATDHLAGDVAVGTIDAGGAAWSDTQWESLRTNLKTQDWADLTPEHLWDFNQASTATAVEDLIGTLDQTAIGGTAVSNDGPAGWTYGVTTGPGSNALAGTVTASSTVSGSLSVTKPLAGAVASMSTITGTLAVTAPLAGAVASTSAVSGTATTTKPLAGAVASASTVSGALSARAALAGAITSTSTVTGAATATAALAGAVASASSLTGDLHVTKSLSAAIAGVTVVAGTLTNTAPGGLALAGVVGSSSTVTGSLTVRASLAGAVLSEGAISGTLAARADLAGAVTSTSSVTGTVAVTAGLSGAVTGTSTLAGSLTNTAAGANALSGAIASTSTVAGTLHVTKPLAGTVVSASSCSGSLTVAVDLAGTVTSTSTAGGTLAVSHPLAGSVTSTSTVQGAVMILRPLAGAVLAAGVVAGSLTNRGPVTAVGRLEAGVAVRFHDAAGFPVFSEGVGSSRVNESTSGVLALSE